jgi:hypothetical protein
MSVDKIRPQSPKQNRVETYGASVFALLAWKHRYRKAKIDCLSFVMCPLLAQPIIAFFSSFFDAAVYSTNEANKAGSTRR